MNEYPIVHSMMDVEELLIEHSLEARLENIRVQMEKQTESEGSENSSGQVGCKWRKPLCVVDVSERHYGK